ncbi:MAG: glycosyltransferase family 2 protein [Spirochaetales bacterium]|nr:glycosyltransferase family 2 protein [Spirochaetales bacterium]
MSIQTVTLLYGILTFAACIFFFLLTVSNILWQFHGIYTIPLKTGPHVSVLVPARNEEQRIRQCLDSLLDQEYMNYSIIVIDDDSEDDTWNILREYMLRFPRKLRAVKSKALPEGWYGKPHAMHQLASMAQGPYLLFTDADTVHSPRSIGKAVAIAESKQADLVTGYVHHLMPTFGEAIAEAGIYLVTMLSLPLWLVPSRRFPSISHAVGQYMLFRKTAYDRIGGYASVRDKVTEDVRIARLLKQAGGRIVFWDLKDYVSCRMYSSYREAIEGMAKNAFDYINKNVLVLIGGTIFTAAAFIIPVLSMVCSLPWLEPAAPYLKSSAILTFYSWVLLTIDRRLPFFVPLVYPIVLINAMSATWRGFDRIRRKGGILWKGRKVS